MALCDVFRIYFLSKLLDINDLGAACEMPPAGFVDRPDAIVTTQVVHAPATLHEEYTNNLLIKVFINTKSK